MQPKVTGTWHDDPAHFQRPTRRSFLYVGFVGGLGLTLDSFFRLQARADTKAGGKEPQAKSIIHIFLPGGMAQHPWRGLAYAALFASAIFAITWFAAQRLLADSPFRRST